MYKILLLFAAIFYSFTVSAGECRVVNNASELAFDDIRIGALKRQVTMGKSYAVLKKSISFTANCDNVSNFSIYYLAKNDGKTYSLDQGNGLYTLRIRNIILNGRERQPKYQDSNQHASHLLPGREVSVENIQTGNQNISISLDVELLIDPTKPDDNVSSSGEFVIHSD
ncbi:hypothetical protein SNQ33_004360 [Cronobacter malonaticus]|nr:hypothetical protein [Cronobacter sakazakii]ELY2773001.1 hypothetical protein [Cronobacter sakazakii]ELY6205928.1 hypothetical protein [Cronobacter malonaticus]